MLVMHVAAWLKPFNIVYACHHIHVAACLKPFNIVYACYMCCSMPATSPATSDVVLLRDSGTLLDSIKSRLNFDPFVTSDKDGDQTEQPLQQMAGSTLSK